jgi:hypothetical protein
MKRTRQVHVRLEDGLGDRIDRFHERRERDIGEDSPLAGSLRRLLELGLDKAEKRGGKSSPLKKG